MVKCSFIILSSVQIRPDKSLLFLLKQQALQLRHTGEMREKHVPLKPFLLAICSLKTGRFALLHPPLHILFRESTSAFGLGLMETGEIALDAWKEKGGAIHIIPI